MALVGDVFQVREGEARHREGKAREQPLGVLLRQLRQPWRERAGILNVGRARRRWVCLSRIPNLNHQLAMVVRIGGEDLRPRSIDPVVGQRANRVGPARTREAKHGAHDRQGGRDHQRQRAEPDAQAGGHSVDRPARQRGALQQPNQEEQPRQHVGRDHLPARAFHDHLRDGDQHREERHITDPPHRMQLRHRQRA
jgi:hypothetical protein